MGKEEVKYFTFSHFLYAQVKLYFHIRAKRKNPGAPSNLTAVSSTGNFWSEVQGENGGST
jgi:hypothetical protein